MFDKVRELSRNLAIYGLGDVATSIVGFILLPVYTRYLSPVDYGILAILGTIEVVSKIVFRWGLDGSFMRFYYDCADAAARQRLASTIFWFMAALNGSCLVLALGAAPFVAGRLFGTSGQALTLQLVLVNTFAIGFTFIPFHVLRIQEKSRQFSALTFSRSAATLVLRLVLVVGAGLGVFGVVLADLVVTAVVLAVMLRWFAPLVRPVFSRRVLAESLRFGLPRLPHGLAQQIMAVGDRAVLLVFVPMSAIGVYSIGVSFGMTLKLFLSAFEYAWAPFYYATAKAEPQAPRIFGVLTTYGVGVLALLAAGLAAVAGDLVPLMVWGEESFAGAERIVPWIALGVLFQGIYLLTSIGLNITKRSEYYPVATLLSAAASLGSNMLLVPRFGILGAAWSNAVAYAVLAGAALHFSRRAYPIPYEWGRLARVALAGATAYAAAALVPAMPHLAGLLVRGGVVVAVYAAALGATGFFRANEIEWLRRMTLRVHPAGASELPPESSEFAGEIVAVDLPAETASAAAAEPERTS